MTPKILFTSMGPHIFRGLLFERTSGKGEFFLWNVVFPLFSRDPQLTLNYGTRLPWGVRDSIFGPGITYRWDLGSLTPAEAFQSLENNADVSEMTRPFGPADFLSKDFRIDRTRPRTLMETCLARFLADDPDGALQAAQECLSTKPVHDWAVIYHHDAQLVVDNLGCDRTIGHPNSARFLAALEEDSRNKLLSPDFR